MLFGAGPGGYKILSKLGSGSGGSVYKAQKKGRIVALKIPKILDPTDLRRLEREATALYNVSNPNVAKIEEADLEGPTPFIATEFIEGQNLAGDVKENGVYEGKYLALLADKLAFALRDIHAANIIHRDIKPENVIIADWGPVLVDFGIAMNPEETHLTRTGLVMGTPGYIAPELLEGGREGAESDWWSLCAVLAFAALGRSPFAGGGVGSILDREERGEADLSPLPPSLAQPFSKALDPDPSRRLPVKDLIGAIWQNV
ncbi:MAG: serine/threonine protein kinase [Aeriscardovia sp.]|nr:serine/threonine protein kinase [Aeriscardovia sp.]